MSTLRARVHMVSAGLLESAANMTTALASLAGQVEAAASQVQSYTESLAQLRLDGAQVTSFGLRVRHACAVRTRLLIFSVRPTTASRSSPEIVPSLERSSPTSFATLLAPVSRVASGGGIFADLVTEAAEGARADQAGAADDQGRRSPAVTIGAYTSDSLMCTDSG